MDGVNPYQPPEVFANPESAGHRKLLWSWALMFVANLLMQAFFAWTLLEDGGGLGILSGTALLLGVSIGSSTLCSTVLQKASC